MGGACYGYFACYSYGYFAAIGTTGIINHKSLIYPSDRPQIRVIFDGEGGGRVLIKNETNMSKKNGSNEVILNFLIQKKLLVFRNQKYKLKTATLNNHLLPPTKSATDRNP